MEDQKPETVTEYVERTIVKTIAQAVTRPDASPRGLWVRIPKAVFIEAEKRAKMAEGDRGLYAGYFSELWGEIKKATRPSSAFPVDWSGLENDRKELLDALTDTQNRCTELREEKIKMVERIKELESLADTLRAMVTKEGLT